MTLRKALLTMLMATVTAVAWAGTTAQRFFNLTAAEVRVDSVLPRFTCSFPLQQGYNDSVYTVRLAWPEFLEMSSKDVECYKTLTDAMPAEMPQVDYHVAIDRKQGSLEVSFVPIVCRGGRLMKLVSFMIDVSSTHRNVDSRSQTLVVLNAQTQTRTASKQGRYASNSVLKSGTWAKISVPESGVYRLTAELVRRAGFSDVSRVKVYGYGGALQPEVLNGDYLAQTDDLHEVPTCEVGGQRLFYAVGPVSWDTATTARRTRNPYSSCGYYFLTDDGTAPLTIDSTAFINTFYPSADSYHVLHEVDNYAWFQGGRNLFENSPVATGQSKTYTLDGGERSLYTGKLSIGVTAGQASTFTIAINGVEQGSFKLSMGTYDNGKEIERTFEIPNPTRETTITLTATEGGPLRLDYVSIAYDEPCERPTLAGTQFNVPEFVCNITNQNHHADAPAQMIIIVPTSGKLLAQAERLRQMHEERDGLTVRTVPADELFNEFSSGTPDANAYRRYLKMLYDRAETENEMPRYLLLFGRGVWDNRLLTADCAGLSADDLLLCYESENSFSSTESYVDDGFFALLDDGEGGALLSSDKPDVAVGRIPVVSESDAKTVVDKVLSYVENANAGKWQNTMMFMGDDGNQNKLMQDADEMASIVETLRPETYVRRVLWDAYERTTSSTGNSYPEVSAIIKQQQADGALIMNYCGHGDPMHLSHEQVLTAADFAAFKNTALPLWITASCDIMPYDMLKENIGENALLNAEGGAVAFFGTARTVYITENAAINRAFLKHLLTKQDGQYPTIGEAMRLAKNEMITSGADRTQNKLQYALLGDPAMRLNLPSLGVVVDSIKGSPTVQTGSLPSLKAGTVATIKGHIEVNGGTDETSNGVVTALVRDCSQLVTCRLNDQTADGADTAYVYRDRTKVLFNGTDSVRGGRFSLTFAVPKDIEYSNENGLINLTAVNNETKTTLTGLTDAFTVGGSGSLKTDSIGPSIYCYLNSPAFTDGDDVNTTPYFVAEISDKDGLNTAGSSIGHDLVLSVDGRSDLTFVLNDNFSYDFGSYTSGRTWYSLPTLDVGRHTLQFRAWDILNNPSTVTLTFNVVEGLAPGTVDAACSDNPARSSTTFIVSHDRSGSAVSIEITVYDLSGCPVWTHSAHDVTSTGAYTVNWNLSTTEGAQLSTGVYLYRVKLTSDGATTTSKTRKLIIIKN